MRRLLLWGALPAALAVGLAGCGDGNAALDGSVDGEVYLTPVDVETSAPTVVSAGDIVNVTCLLVDAMGETFTPPPTLRQTLRWVPADSVERQEDGTYMAIRAGVVEVACVFESERLSDETPSLVEIVPGPAARVVTTLDRDSVEAGETSRARCDVFDAFGNRVEGSDVTLRSEPTDDGNAFEDTLGTFTKAGRFDVFCDVTGAEGSGAPIEVRPGLPASLVISRVPDQPTYARGQVVDIRRLVHDQYDNLVLDADVPVTSEPAGQQLGDGRFRYVEDGAYTLTATVQPPTHDDIPLSASTIVIVDGGGPAIGCDDPFDGQILDMHPGDDILFRGSVADLSGVSEVRVDGAAVPLAADGTFAAPLGTKYGINFVDLAAIDGSGQESSRTCAFLVAESWAPDSRTSGDIVSLRLRQDAIDDRNRGDGLDSLNDILATVLNSSGLHTTLHNTLLANNPLKPSSCDESVWGVCVLRSEVIYLSSQINGPNTTRLDLVDGGMGATLRVENLRVRVRVRGHVAGIPYDTTGWVTFEYVQVETVFDTRLAGGRPRITVRPGSVRTTVGRVSTDFDGIDGAIVNIVVAVFNGTVRNMIAGVVTNYVTDNFNDILDGVVSGLDVSSLGTSFNVPRLDSEQVIPLTFGLSFSHLTSTPSRMLFGIGTRFFAPPTHARPTLGAPMQAGARILDASGSQTAAVGVHEALLNQALHALWRGGFFDLHLDDSTGLGLPAGVRADLSLGLPPVAVVQAGGRLEISLGALSMVLVYPELFAEPVALSLGAQASMAVRLSGDDLIFEDFRMEEIYFSTDLASLDMSTRDTVEGFLRRLLERILAPALNDALPAIPIPSFELPASLATFGLPAGAELGVVRPALANEPPHFVLRGSFAVR